MRHLSTELVDKWRSSEDDGSPAYKELSAQLLKLAKVCFIDGERVIPFLRQDICAYNMAHNVYTEAVDVVMEIERLDLLTEFVPPEDQPNIVRYLLRCECSFRSRDYDLR